MSRALLSNSRAQTRNPVTGNGISIFHVTSHRNTSLSADPTVISKSSLDYDNPKLPGRFFCQNWQQISYSARKNHRRTKVFECGSSNKFRTGCRGTGRGGCCLWNERWRVKGRGVWVVRARFANVENHHFDMEHG